MKFSIRKLLLVTTVVAACFAFANFFPLFSRMLIGPALLVLAAVILENGRCLIWLPAAFFINTYLFEDHSFGISALVSIASSVAIVLTSLTYYSVSKTLDQFRQLGGQTDTFVRSVANTFFGGIYIGITVYAAALSIWAIEFYYNVAPPPFSVGGLVGFPMVGALFGLLISFPIAVISEFVIAMKTPSGDW